MKIDFSSFSKSRILVIGDMMLDSYVYGTSERNCPEAPAPVFEPKREKKALGGCGMVISNIKNLSGIPIPLCVVGNDEEAKELRMIISGKGIDISGILVDPDRPTTSKKRIVLEPENRILVRIDNEKRNEISGVVEKAALNFIKSELPKCNAVVISDYCKGMLSEEITKEILVMASKNNIPLIVDTKGSIAKYKGATLFTPNEKEAVKFASELGIFEYNIEEIGKALSEKTNSAILIKMGESGVALFEGGNMIKFPSAAKNVLNVSGAGDILVSATSLMIASGQCIKDSVDIGNKAAGIAIGKEVPEISLKELGDFK